ncbi:MAG: MFS transporter [Spirochaetaceae bacterium]|nr:MAG: MFS transporter [Spirochaetaceae bacterium]
MEKQPSSSALIPGLMFFVFFASASMLLPFFGLHYRSVGMNELQVGVLAGLKPLMVVFGAGISSAAADATGRHATVLAVVLLGMALTVFGILHAASFPLLFVLTLMFAFCFASVGPILDNTTLHMLGSRADSFGRVRVWGGIGWAIAAFAIGYGVEHWGLVASFYGFIGGIMLSLVVSRFLQVPRSGFAGGMLNGLGTILRTKGWPRFLVLVFFGGLGIGAMNSYLLMYMQDIGSSGRLMGMAVSIGTVSELALFVFAPLLLARVGPRRLIIVSLFGNGIRLLAYSVTVVPLLVLPIQMLHGAAFGLLFIGGVSYAARIAPSGLGTAAQGVMNSALFGLGAFAGAVFGGALYQHLGPLLMFRVIGAVVLGAALLFSCVPGLAPKDAVPHQTT